jgi:hypothetical protein
LITRHSLCSGLFDAILPPLPTSAVGIIDNPHRTGLIGDNVRL